MINWGKIRPLLFKALKRSGDKQTIDDVKTAIEGGKCQLWTTNDNETAVVTELSLDLNVWLYAGNFKEIEQLDASAAAYAKSLGAGHMTVWDGRKGWKRALKHLGYVEKTILVKEL